MDCHLLHPARTTLHPTDITLTQQIQLVKGKLCCVKPKLKSPLLPKLKCPHTWRQKVDRVYKMSEKEIKKTEMMNQLAEKQITQRIAAERLGLVFGK